MSPDASEPFEERGVSCREHADIGNISENLHPACHVWDVWCFFSMKTSTGEHMELVLTHTHTQPLEMSYVYTRHSLFSSARARGDARGSVRLEDACVPHQRNKTPGGFKRAQLSKTFQRETSLKVFRKGLRGICKTMWENHPRQDELHHTSVLFRWLNSESREAGRRWSVHVSFIRGTRGIWVLWKRDVSWTPEEKVRDPGRMWRLTQSLRLLHNYTVISRSMNAVLSIQTQNNITVSVIV